MVLSDKDNLLRYRSLGKPVPIRSPPLKSPSKPHIPPIEISSFVCSQTFAIVRSALEGKISSESAMKNKSPCAFFTPTFIAVCLPPFSFL